MQKLNGFSNIYVSNLFEHDLEKIIKGSSLEKKFQIWFLDRLKQIDEIGFNIYDYPRKFEKINEFYIMTYRNKEKNIRIIYYLKDNKINLLLCAFDEKKTRADYNRNIIKARSRLEKEGSMYE